MKKVIGIIILIAVVFFGVRVYTQKQEIDAIPDAAILDSELLPIEEPFVEGDSAVGATETSGGATSEEATSAVSTVVVTSTPAGLEQSESEFTVDFDQTYFTFEGYAPGKSHAGTFETYQATLNFDEVKTVTGGSIVIEAASVKSDSQGLDGHLRNEDFFDVTVYPTIEYTLKNIVFNSGSGEASAIGTLTFHGVTKDITSPVTILENGFNAKFNLSMKEFGIEYTGVNDEVTIEVQVVLQ